MKSCWYIINVQTPYQWYISGNSMIHRLMYHPCRWYVADTSLMHRILPATVSSSQMMHSWCILDVSSTHLMHQMMFPNSTSRWIYSVCKFSPFWKEWSDAVPEFNSHSVANSCQTMSIQFENMCILRFVFCVFTHLLQCWWTSIVVQILADMHFQLSQFSRHFLEITIVRSAELRNFLVLYAVHIQQIIATFVGCDYAPVLEIERMQQWRNWWSHYLSQKTNFLFGQNLISDNFPRFQIIVRS